jgi:hypothetical protein
MVLHKELGVELLKKLAKLLKADEPEFSKGIKKNPAS